MKTCENIKCKKEHNGSFGSGRFCCRSCANSRNWTEDDKKKKSDAVKKAFKENDELRIKAVQRLNKYRPTGTNSEKIIRNCFYLACDNLIETTIKQNRKYCNKNCYFNQKNLQAKVGRICLNQQCNNTFIVNKANDKKYCSFECASNSKKRKKRCSISKKEEYKKGRNVYGGTADWYVVNTKTNGKIKVQGTYEKRTCKILDNWVDNNKIYDWNYTNDRFEYKDKSGEERTYLLDFKVFKNKNEFYYIETKGYETDNDEYKWKSVRKKGNELKVWFEEDITFYEDNLNIK